MLSRLHPITRLWVLLFSTMLVGSLSIPSNTIELDGSAKNEELENTPFINNHNNQEDIQNNDNDNDDGDYFDLGSNLDSLGFDLVGQVPLHLPPHPNQSGILLKENNQGWLSKLLSMSGEGEVVVHLPPVSERHNISLPHRPASFPDISQLSKDAQLPLSGFLISFEKLISSSSEELDYHDNKNHEEKDQTQAIWNNEKLGCLKPIGLPRPPPKNEFTKIGLIERGGCDFATKVRSAQDKGLNAVIVGDSPLHPNESDEEGRKRQSLITMFSPEDTDSISIPSVFVSRASYLTLRDLLANGTSSGRQENEGLWIDISQGSDDTGALTSLLSFALLMPTLFLLCTIAIHRFRLARQREKDRAPPMIVLSLPERVWTPDIVWEKDDSSPELSIHSHPSRSSSPTNNIDHPILINKTHASENDEERPIASSSSLPLSTPPPPPISASEVRTPPAVSIEMTNPLDNNNDNNELSIPNKLKIAVENTKKQVKRQYFSKDECAICMDNFQRGDIVRILPCGHVFHKEECDEWLMKWRKLCPTCRADVTLPSGANIKGSTITPVSNPPNTSNGLSIDGLPEGGGQRSWTSFIRSARERLYGYGNEIRFGVGRNNNRLRLDETSDGSSQGERTPLVTRSPGPSGDRGQSTDV